jgi:capsular polysaccharide biosynthesis protein/O-antigen/teichoic acid export membrane protein
VIKMFGSQLNGKVHVASTENMMVPNQAFGVTREDEPALPQGDPIRVILRRLWIIVLAPALFAGLVVGYSIAQTPTYQASTTVLVGQEQADDVSGDLGNELEGLQSLSATVAAAVGTRPIAEGVVQKLDLGIDPSSLQESLDAEVVPDTTFVRISYTDTDPQRAQLIADAVGEVLAQRITDVSPSANTVTVTVWERALVPADPVSPDPLRDGLLGLVLGLMIGVGLAFLLDFLDDDLKSPDEVEQVSGVPTFASIPEFKVHQTAEARRTGRRWLTKGFWAVMDQGLFAMSNFVLNVLLARWLSPSDYGAFSVAFAVFLLIASLHTATLCEPMLVFGSGKYKSRLPEYLGILVYGNMGFAALGSLALLLASLCLALWGSSSLSGVLLALALVGPFVLLLWLMRRACYVRLDPRLAASGGAWYMALMLAGAYVLYRFEWLSAASALGVMGGSSLLASLWLAARLRMERPSLRNNELLRDTLESHWRWGRWSTATQGLAWLPGNIYFLLLPIWGGLDAAAAFKALTNLLMPMLQANAALTSLLLPVLVRARENSTFGTHVRLALIPFVLAPTLYWILLGALHRPLVSWLYGGQYTEQASLLWLLGLVPIAASVRGVLAQSWKALERPEWLFWASALSGVVAVTLGLWCVYVWGIFGAGLGFLISQVVAAVAAAALLLVLYRRSHGKAFLREARESSQ